MLRVSLSPPNSELGDPGARAWEWSGLVDWWLEGGESAEVAAWQSRLKGSKVVTVPQFSPLWRLLVLLRGTQGSWKVWGDDVGVRLAVCSRRGLEEERKGLLRLVRRLNESERNGGGGGRLDLRREMLWELERE